MGIDPNLFTEPVLEELHCSICEDVFEDPMTCKVGHVFCRKCITSWIKLQKAGSKCPVDMQPTTIQDLQPAPLILKSILASLKVRCMFAQAGCEKMVSSIDFEGHRKACLYNPRRDKKAVDVKDFVESVKLCNSKKIEEYERTIRALRTRVKQKEKVILSMSSKFQQLKQNSAKLRADWIAKSTQKKTDV